jgi:hypothetical protein
MNEEDPDEHVLWVETLPLFLLHELLFQVGELID